MSLKKTEEFLYFQHKARHYANLRNAKPTLKTTRRSMTTSHTRNNTISPPHGETYFHRYDINRQNQGLIERITEIMTGPRLQIEKQGYTRYNRQFSPRSHLQIELKKSQEAREEGNHHMAQKVLLAKPSVGTIVDWTKHYHANREIKSNISKYNNKRASRGTLEIYSSNNYMPEHYKSFIGQESPEQLTGNVKMKGEHLFQLPKLRQLRGSMTRIGENGQKVQDF